MGILTSLQDLAFTTFVYMPRSVIPGSYGNSIFNVLRNLHPVFHNNCVNLHPYPAIYKCSLFSKFFSAFVMCCLFNGNHPNRCEVMSHCFLICISLMTTVVEHLFMYPLAICMSSLEKCLFRSFVHFKNQVICFLYI